MLLVAVTHHIFLLSSKNYKSIKIIIFTILVCIHPHCLRIILTEILFKTLRANLIIVTQNPNEYVVE